MVERGCDGRRSGGAAILGLAMLIGLSTSACGSIGRVRAFPLYPGADHPRTPESLARLEGPIQFVDSLDVEAHGTVFDVLPGCHVVTLRRTIGDISQNGGVWWADLGWLTYAFRMKAGRVYSVEYTTAFGSAGHGTMRLAAYERDSEGRVLGTVGLVRSEGDIVACRAWEAAQRNVDPAPGAASPQPLSPSRSPTPTLLPATPNSSRTSIAM